jgi:hypothetical protein
MGGFGSGRKGGRATVEGCRSLKLDVNRITRDVRGKLREVPEGAKLEAGPMVWTWTTQGEAAPWARVLVTLRLDPWRGEARLVFDVDHYSRRTGPQDQTVQMETTPCRFGGRRWWWLCPATMRRCSTLYLPNGGTRFLSRGRGAYPLAYASQNGSAMDRSHARLARLHRKMGADYDNPDAPPPPRPKWMRHHTYARLVAELKGQVERHDDIWLAGAERMMARAR